MSNTSAFSLILDQSLLCLLRRRNLVRRWPRDSADSASKNLTCAHALCEQLVGVSPVSPSRFLLSLTQFWGTVLPNKLITLFISLVPLSCFRLQHLSSRAASIHPLLECIHYPVGNSSTLAYHAQLHFHDTNLRKRLLVWQKQPTT